MALLVRRLRVMDLPILEQMEADATARYPSRVGWMPTYRRYLERALSEEPEGILVAELADRVAGGAVARQKGPHPMTGLKHGVLQVLTVSEAYAKHNVAQRLLLEAGVYLKSRGCKSMLVSLPSDAGEGSELYKGAGFTVTAWDLERTL